MSDAKATINDLKTKIEKFIQDREWEKYRSPKNLAMSISVEAAELMEEFQWLNDDESLKKMQDKKKKEKTEQEVADIAIYLLDFCNSYNIDLTKAIENKLKHNEEKYPVNQVKGKNPILCR